MSYLDALLRAPIAIADGTTVVSADTVEFSPAVVTQPQPGRALVTLSSGNAFTWENSGAPLAGPPTTVNVTGGLRIAIADPGVFEITAPSLAGALPPGLIADIPATSSVSVGTTYYALDANYTFVNGSDGWYIATANTVAQKAPGNLSAWTYESALPAAANLLNNGTYPTLHSNVIDSVPYLKAFWNPVTLVETDDWTITACFRWTGQTGSLLNTLYQNVGLAFGDNSGHQFLFGPQLTDSYFANAHASGYSAFARNYYSGLTSKEFSQLIPAPETYFIRVIKSGTTYTTQWSRDGIAWTTSVNGGTGVLRWGATAGQNLTPTKWGIGTQFVPTEISWDILSLHKV